MRIIVIFFAKTSLLLFATTSLAEADATTDFYKRTAIKFNYAVKTNDHSDACIYSKMLESTIKDLGAELGEYKFDEIRTMLTEQKAKTSYHCNLAESKYDNGAENKAEGAEFLLQNAKKAHIVTTASGLQYEILIAGTGTTKPSATDNVTVHYKGSTLDGKEFDSSYSRGEPTSFPLNRVITGWTEGVQLMTVGAKYRFYIPAALAYGSQGNGPISPNATLIFDIELLKI